MKLNSLTANFPEFRPVVFRDGLNVIVAERSKEATKTDSRNGLGKTTAIAIVDFCLGANLSDRLRQMQGHDWFFTLSLTTRSGITLSVSRSPDTSAEIHIEGDVVSAGIVTSEEVAAPGSVDIGTRHWTKWLGRECFSWKGMPAEPPSFRSLLRHLVRYRPDSLIDPFRTIANQGAQAVQAENAYLLGLDWRFASEWSRLKEHKARVALADDPEASIDAQIASLEPRLVRIKRRTEQLRQDIAEFSVLPEYRDIEERVQESTAAIKKITNENLADRQQLALYESQMEEEFVSSGLSVERVFAEAGIVLGESVIRSIDEAAEFQRQVVANRAEYLADEARRIRDRIAQREAEQVQIAARQEQDLQLLQTGGALEDFAALQGRLAESQVEVSQVEENIRTLRELNERKAKLKADELELMSRTKLDLQERFELRSDVIARFGEIVEALYGEPADLIISPGKSGVQFKTTLPKTGSGGVHLMSIFAYDVALSENLSAVGRGPGFLIHDSAIFADVDERQKAKAIEIAAESALENGYQYLITMNSDHVPWTEFSDSVVFEEGIVLRLNDGDPSGGILGQRIVSSEKPDSE